jgi:excisionase family DNA binding protein
MSNDCDPGERLLTKGEVAQLCRVEIRTVDRWVAAGKITCYRTPGGRLLFREGDVLRTADRWIERLAPTPTSPDISRQPPPSLLQGAGASRTTSSRSVLCDAVDVVRT